MTGGIAWNPMVLPGLFAFAAVVAMAVLVYRTRPERTRNRRLALLLAYVGAAVFVGRPLRLVIPNIADAFALALVGLCLLAFMPLAYAQFLATLETPLAKPFRRASGYVALGAYGLAVLTAVVVVPGRIIDHMEPFPHVDAWSFVPGWAPVIELTATAFLLYAFAAAVSAARRAQTPAKIRELRAYAVAFGVHDGLLALWFLFVGIDGIWNQPITDTTWIGNQLTFLVEPTLSLLLAVLLGYGILRHQIFGIELKLKFAVEKSTVAAVFAVGFLMVSEVVERVVGIEGTLFGLGAAVAIGLVFRRIEALAEAVADRLMPGVENTPSYRADRRRALYQAAVEAAIHDRRVTDRERDVLSRLQAELELSTQEAAEIESTILETASGHRAPADGKRTVGDA